MTPEGRDLYATLERLTEDLLRPIAAIGTEGLDWRPDAPETNSPAAIVTHALGASRHWLVAIVAGEPNDRDREAEFRALAKDVGDIQARARTWLGDARRVLESMTVADFDGPCRRPTTTQEWMAKLTARGAILHVVEHIGLHIGHLELTAQLWNAQKVAT